MIVLLFLSGRIYESIKRLLVLFIDILLKILNLFGIHIDTKEQRISTSKRFKQTFKDIRVVKKSKENNKLKPSINPIALILLLSSIAIVIINLGSVSGNAISSWLFEHNPFPFFIKSQENMDVTLTAILFSIIAFSISKLINQWKATAKFRVARKQMKKKDEVLCMMSAKELLDAAKKKDADGYEQHLKITSVESADENTKIKETRKTRKKNKGDSTPNAKNF